MVVDALQTRVIDCQERTCRGVQEAWVEAQLGVVKKIPLRGLFVYMVDELSAQHRSMQRAEMQQLWRVLDNDFQELCRVALHHTVEACIYKSEVERSIRDLRRMSREILDATQKVQVRETRKIDSIRTVRFADEELQVTEGWRPISASKRRRWRRKVRLKELASRDGR